MEKAGEQTIMSISTCAGDEDNSVVHPCEEIESPSVGVKKLEDCDIDSDQKVKDACMFCDDSCFDVKSREAYSAHVREVHRVTKNLDILLQFIIEQEARGNTVRSWCCV